MESLENKLEKKRRHPRNYNGNPLAYFREHIDEYDGMPRGEFSRADPGLYRALVRAGQINEAIQGKLSVKRVTKEEIREIFKKSKKKPLTQIAKEMHCSVQTIKKWLRNKKKYCPKLQFYQDGFERKLNRILDTAEQYRTLDPKELEKYLSHKDETIQRYLNVAKLLHNKKYLTLCQSLQCS